MNLVNLFNRVSRDPALGLTLAQLVAACNSGAPKAAFASVLGESAVDPDISFFPGNNTQTNCIIANDAFRIIVCLGGATNKAQIVGYIDGVALGPDPRDNIGVARSFYVAARTHVNDMFSRGGYLGKQVLFVGHSYGGAVAQVAGIYLLSLGQARSVSMISFGAPRAGGHNLVERLRGNDNVRWINDGDVVPWMLPHVDEIPAMPLVALRTLWDQTNGMVQAPSGYILKATGQIIPSMGSPPKDWGYFLSLYSYVSDLMVNGAGPFHSIQEYIGRLQRAAALGTQIPPRPNQRPEEALTLRPRELQGWIETGGGEWAADATDPTGHTRTYQVPPVTSPDTPRYRAARVHRVWCVKLGTEVVAAATGKRHARMMARKFNRAARAAVPNGL